MPWHDQLHKDLLHRTLPSFLEAFVPDLAKHIDPSSLTFLQQSFGDIEEGNQNEVDILARFKRIGANDHDPPRYILVHLEHQHRREKDFPHRMLYYYMKIKLKNRDAEIYPIVLYTHDSPTPEECEVNLCCLGFECLRFRFHPIQLRLEDWRTWSKVTNPAVAALLANMGKRSENRVERKLAAYQQIDRLVGQDTPKDQLHLVSVYLDTYLDLSKSEALQLAEGMNKIGLNQESQLMEYLTKLEREAIDRGMAKGMQQGLEKGMEQGLEQGLEREREIKRNEVLTRVLSGLKENEISLTKAQSEKLERLSFARLLDAFASLHRAPEKLPSWIDSLSE